MPALPEDHFNGPLYTLKAFGIATGIVMSTSAATIAAVMAYLDVRDTAEFADHMRTWISRSMPLLTAKIYRRPTSRDVIDSFDPVLLAVPTPQSWALDHDASEQRLASAFDKGGLEAWTEAAAREMEMEMQMERARREAKLVD